MSDPVRILVVDDDADLRIGTARLLEKAGYLVDQAEDGEAALQAIRQQRPDMVLLDRDLPGLDGLDICRTIKQDPACAGIAVIIVSGVYVESDHQVEGLEFGADGYIVRPISNRELLARVRAYVRIQSLTRALQSKIEELEAAKTAASQSALAALNLLEDAVAARDQMQAANQQLQREIEERKRAEEALRRLSQRHEATLAAIPDIVMEVNKDKIYTWANRAGIEFFGDDVLGKEAAFYFEGDQDTYRRVEPLWNGKEDVIYVESWQRRRDGARRLLAWWCRVLKDADGNVTGALSSARDITELRQAEERIRQSEETYRNLFHNAQVGLFRTRISDGKVLESNEQLARMFGYDSREEFIADYATSANYVDPGTRERMLAMLRRDGFVENFEARFYRKDRSIFWARYSARIYPEQGWIEGVAEDITTRKQAEEALRVSEERFRRAVEHAPYPAAIHTEDGEVLLVNAEWTRLTGYTREDIPTVETWLEKAYGERRHEARRRIAALYAANGPMAVPDIVIRCRDGTTRTWSFRSTALSRDERGRMLALSMAADVTERQLLEAQLRQAQKMEAIGRLAGGVAHDFNNLLQAMTTAVHALRLRFPEAATARATAELEQYIKRGANLTRQLLLSSRRAQPQIELCDINDVVRRAEALLRRLLPENISVRTELAEGQLFINGDPAQLEQVLMNLAVNARDAMPEGGRLTVRTVCPSETEVFIDVEDSGVGIGPAVRERIFEPFFTTKAQGAGTGLGLAVVHGIVTQHGGRVEVESEPGHGSRFRVVLPRRLGLRDDWPAAEEAAGEPARGRGERVLVVEDEEGAREGLAELLALLGYDAKAVASAEEALALPEDTTFHALLTDLMLPGMTGGRLATTLLARWPGLGVILMSGYPEDERVRHEVPAGVRFLQKPFDVDTLAQALRAVLDARRSQ